MKLSTRMTLAMVALVLLTAVAVGGLTYRNLKAVMLPRAFTRSQLDLQLLTTELSSYAGGARQDITGFRTAVALKGIVRAHLAGGIDPVDGTTEAVWRQRMASRYATELAAKPAYEQFRMIAANGKELVRVDRSRVDGAVGIVPDTELQQKADRGYFQDALRLPADKIYVSPVELNQEHGTIESPHVPVLRVAAIIEAPDQMPFGIVIINVDMRPIFREIASSARPGSKIYIVDDRGNYLAHPDSGMEFGSDLGRPIIRAVIGLGHGLRLPVVAEGVETKEQLAFLRQEDCNEVQGYLFGRPAPIAQYARLTGCHPVTAPAALAS